jgi:glutamate synthase domain-containing protein 2
VGGDYQWRKEGEKHLFSPETIHGLQKAARTNDYEALQAIRRKAVNEQDKQLLPPAGSAAVQAARTHPPGGGGTH